MFFILCLKHNLENTIKEARLTLNLNIPKTHSIYWPFCITETSICHSNKVFLLLLLLIFVTKKCKRADRPDSENRDKAKLQPMKLYIKKKN